MISMDYDSWLVIKKRLLDDWSRSVVLVRERSKEVLGFTTRYHRAWKKNSRGKWELEETIHLDFFDDNKETWFRLKYMEYE